MRNTRYIQDNKVKVHTSNILVILNIYVVNVMAVQFSQGTYKRMYSWYIKDNLVMIQTG